MDAIQQTRFFARNYAQLQGLRTVPVSLCLLAITLWANRLQGRASDLTFPIATAMVCLALYLLVDRYYNRMFGRVKREVTHLELFLQAAAAALALAAFVVDTNNLVDLSLLGLVFAAVFAFTGFWYRRLSKTLFVIYQVLAVLFVGLSVLSLLGVQQWWGMLGIKHSLLAFTFLYGIFCVVIGIIAHIYFIRLLPKTVEA